FAQRREAFAGGVLQRLARRVAQHLVAGRADRRHRERVGRRQAAGHRQHARALGQLEDLSDDRRVHARAAARQLPGTHAGSLFDGGAVDETRRDTNTTAITASRNTQVAASTASPSSGTAARIDRNGCSNCTWLTRTVPPSASARYQ